MIQVFQVLENGKTIFFKQRQLVENEDIISVEGKIAQIFNEFYGSIVVKLELSRPPSLEVLQYENHIEKCIGMYRNHPSIIEIKSKRL